MNYYTGKVLFYKNIIMIKDIRVYTHLDEEIIVKVMCYDCNEELYYIDWKNFWIAVSIQELVENSRPANFLEKILYYLR